jgi:hypothetical protein
LVFSAMMNSLFNSSFMWLMFCEAE